MADYSSMNIPELEKAAQELGAKRAAIKAEMTEVQKEISKKLRSKDIDALSTEQQQNLYEQLGQVLGAKGIPTEEAVGTPGAE